MSVEELLEQKTKPEIAALIRDLLLLLGEDPDREGLLKTPERVERTLRFLTQGYRQNPEELFTRARFAEPYDEMVLVKDIDFFSSCEHHLIPFFGKCMWPTSPTEKSWA